MDDKDVNLEIMPFHTAVEPHRRQRRGQRGGRAECQVGGTTGGELGVEQGRGLRSGRTSAQVVMCSAVGWAGGSALLLSFPKGGRILVIAINVSYSCLLYI